MEPLARMHKDEILRLRLRMTAGRFFITDPSSVILSDSEGSDFTRVRKSRIELTDSKNETP
jgi:hypothetical protein